MVRAISDITRCCSYQNGASTVVVEGVYYDRKHIPLEFKVREKVLLSTKHLQLDGSLQVTTEVCGTFCCPGQGWQACLPVKPRYQVC